MPNKNLRTEFTVRNGTKFVTLLDFTFWLRNNINAFTLCYQEVAIAMEERVKNKECWKGAKTFRPLTKCDRSIGDIWVIRQSLPGRGSRNTPPRASFECCVRESKHDAKNSVRMMEAKAGGCWGLLCNVVFVVKHSFQRSNHLAMSKPCLLIFKFPIV